MADKEFMTADGLEKLRGQLSDLQEQLKAHRIYKGREAIEAGDSWHDNPVFYQAEAQERVLLRAIAELEVRIQNAEVISPPEQVVAVVPGCRVQIRFSDGTVATYRVLGEADSDPAAGILSYRSPLGSALLDRVVGDRITYKVGDLVERVQILSIEAM